MQAGVEQAFQQALGIFEKLDGEDALVKAGVFPGNDVFRGQWLNRVVPVLTSAGLTLPVSRQNGSYTMSIHPDNGGRKKLHTEHLKQLVDDLQQVYRIAPTAKW